MKNVKRLTFRVIYEVGLCDVDLPNKVYDEIQDHLDDGELVGVDPTKYPELQEWITNNVRERNCMRHEAEVKDYQE